MANYVKFKQGLKKDFNTTNQPLINGMIYFVIDEHNNGSIYYDTIVDGEHATKKGTVHRVKFSGLSIKITGSVTGTGVISKDGETIEINTSTNHSHGLAHQDFTVTLSNDDTNLKWTRLGNQNGAGFWLKSIKGDVKAPAWFQPNYGAGIAFGGGSTKGIISVKYNEPSVRFAGGNGDAPVWYFTITGSNNKTYDLSKIGGHSSDSAKLDHNVTFKIASTANATIGGSGTTTNLSGAAVNLYLPTKISGFDLLQATRFQGNADTSTVAAKLGRNGNTSLPMTFYWDGSKGGQPTWLWGGENGTDMYVYNPSNFKVSYANNAGSADTVDGYHANAFVKKVGDTTTGSIINNSNGGSWRTGRDRAIIKNTTCNEAAGSTWHAIVSVKSINGSFEMGCLSGENNLRFVYTSDADYAAGNNSSTTCGYFSNNGVFYGAAWNDYAEYRQTKEYIQPGYCVIETGKGDLIKSSERLQPGANIVSDTFGFAIGETEQTKTPLAVSGRVLAYPYEDRDSYQAGDPVCSGPNGTISKMTREEVREYPDRIIGTVSEIPSYEVWGTGNVKVNNRIWIKVK